ncbi:MAG TPA: ComF family protein [Bacteroidales bacterium]|nr:ComF family protein [Bacteroidales bacterium]
MSFLNDFIGLIYPLVCPVCGKSLFRGEKTICTKCYHHLARSRFAKDEENPAARVFWGRVPLTRAHAAFLYTKGNAVQKLIHHFKYGGHKETGKFLGRELGKEICSIEAFNDLDLIIPVPLHPRKKKKRGFNQSEIIAEGISEAVKIPVKTDQLLRHAYTNTQTRKSKYDRWQNVEQIFRVKDIGALKGKHILLVDDVITTGATMEACIQSLLEAEGARVSAGAVAFTWG